MARATAFYILAAVLLLNAAIHLFNLAHADDTYDADGYIQIDEDGPDQDPVYDEDDPVYDEADDYDDDSDDL